MWFFAVKNTVKAVTNNNNGLTVTQSLLIGSIPIAVAVIIFFVKRFISQSDKNAEATSKSEIANAAQEVRIQNLEEANKLLREDLAKIREEFSAKADKKELEEWKTETKEGLNKRPLQSDLELIKDGMEALHAAQQSMSKSMKDEMEAVHSLISETQHSSLQWMQKMSQELQEYHKGIQEDVHNIKLELDQVSEKVEEWNDKTVVS